MKLKQRVSLYVSIAFSIVMGVAFLVVFWSFSSYRQEDFHDRLERKARITSRLLFDIEEIDEVLLGRIEENAEYKMWDECYVAFDQNNQVVFSSGDEFDWVFSENLLQKFTKGKVSAGYQKLEILGLELSAGDKEYKVFIAAEDKFGHQKLNFLRWLMSSVFVVCTLFIGLFTSKLVRNALKPLNDLQEEITNITTSNLNKLIPEGSAEDEIAALTKAFNQMLERINEGYRAQAAFTSNASHELRTPISRILFQLENLIAQHSHSPEVLAYLQSIKGDANQMAELTSSLLILAKISRDKQEPLSSLRIDEVIFEAYENLGPQMDKLRISFDILEPESDFVINGSRSLLEIVFSNLLRNANHYSSDHKAEITVDEKEGELIVCVSNEADHLVEEDPENYMKPFVRGNHSNIVSGSGLGLSIVKRIMDFHHAKVDYQINGSRHRFVLRFPLLK
ncbi:MAG: HAMP domain-containing protein [Crocinitomicaceae bacterium]|jgi:signal transduction histidine kinase|nr:HAMP domain-containing protein [Crocinitomicaceae bacterium]